MILFVLSPEERALLTQAIAYWRKWDDVRDQQDAIDALVLRLASGDSGISTRTGGAITTLPDAQAEIVSLRTSLHHLQVALDAFQATSARRSLLGRALHKILHR